MDQKQYTNSNTQQVQHLKCSLIVAIIQQHESGRLQYTALARYESHVKLQRAFKVP